MAGRRMVRVASAVMLCALASLSGCASYVVPGGPAPLGALGATSEDQAIYGAPNLKKYYDAKPLAQFPAMVAVARVQSVGYESRTARGYGQGAYSVVTTRDAESDETMSRLQKLPQVLAIAPINRLLLPAVLKDEDTLRESAARLKADVLVLYTFDTKFYVKDFAKVATVFSLGLSPNRRAYVTTTASAVIIDVRSGFIYGGAEATAASDKLANGWSSEDAVDETRLKTERESFDKLVGELETSWVTVLATYARPAATAPAQ
jgi:hypothetical protein